MLPLNDCRIISYKQSCGQDLGATLWRQESGSAGVSRPVRPGHVIHEATLRARPRFLYKKIDTRAVARQQQIKEAPRVRRQLLKHDPLQSTAGPGAQAPPPKVAGGAAAWRAEQVSRLGVHAHRESKHRCTNFLPVGSQACAVLPNVALHGERLLLQLPRGTVPPHDSCLELPQRL
jgi:hypothetical protein